MEYIIPAAAAVIVAIIEAVAMRERKAAKAHADLRIRESKLAMKMQSANIQLSLVNANAVLGGHNNGNVAKAREAAEKAQEEYEAFLREVVSMEKV